MDVRWQILKTKKKTQNKKQNPKVHKNSLSELQAGNIVRPTRKKHSAKVQ